MLQIVPQPDSYHRIIRRKLYIGFNRRLKVSKINSTSGTIGSSYNKAKAVGPPDSFEQGEVFLREGGAVNLKDKAGMTTLMIAAEAGREALVRALLDLGADRHLQDHTGKTALTIAKNNDHVKVVYVFI